VTSFDVAEHGVPDDVAALRSLSACWRPAARLPRFRLDWLRRTTAGALAPPLHRRHCRAPEEAGLIVEHLSYATLPFFLSPWPSGCEKGGRREPDRPDDGRGPFGGLFAAVLSAEAPVVARAGLPFGLR
jgi:hypothetical protein